MRRMDALPSDRRRAFAQALFLVLLVVVSYFCLRANPGVAPATGWDKLDHLATFAVLALLAVGAFPGRRAAIGLGLLGYGVAIELIQAWVPGRSAEVGDAVADALGIALGMAVAVLLRRPRERS